MECYAMNISCFFSTIKLLSCISANFTTAALLAICCLSRYTVHVVEVVDGLYARLPSFCSGKLLLSIHIKSKIDLNVAKPPPPLFILLPNQFTIHKRSKAYLANVCMNELLAQILMGFSPLYH